MAPLLLNSLIVKLKLSLLLFIEVIAPLLVSCSATSKREPAVNWPWLLILFAVNSSEDSATRLPLRLSWSAFMVICSADKSPAALSCSVVIANAPFVAILALPKCSIVRLFSCNNPLPASSIMPLLLLIAALLIIALWPAAITRPLLLLKVSMRLILMASPRLLVVIILPCSLSKLKALTTSWPALISAWLLLIAPALTLSIAPLDITPESFINSLFSNIFKSLLLCNKPCWLFSVLLVIDNAPSLINCPRWFDKSCKTSSVKTPEPACTMLPSVFINNILVKDRFSPCENTTPLLIKESVTSCKLSLFFACAWR